MALPELSIEEVEHEYMHRYDTRQQFIYGNMAISLLVATIVVILRFIARRKRGIKITWNDYMIVFALLMTTVFSGLVARATQLGLGTHVVIVGKDKAIEVAKMLTIAEIIFPVAGSAIRLSVLMFYVQVFGDNIRWFTNGVRILASQWILIAFVAVLCTSLQCIPIKLAWSSDHAQCFLDIEKFILSMTLYAVFVNFATLFLPLPLIWRLRLNMRKKIAVAALFALAGGDILLNILRAAFTHEISPHIIDVTWRQVNNAVLGMLELNVAIICACIPTLQPLFTRVANKVGNAIDRAEMKHQIQTVPFVLMKTKPGTQKPTNPNVHPQGAPQNDRMFLGDEEKLIETPLPAYSQISQPKSTLKGLFRKDGTIASWLGSRHTEEVSEKTLLGTQTSAMSWKPGNNLESEIAQNLMQSGYPKARYSSSPRPRQKSDTQQDSFFKLPAQPRHSSRSRTRGLNLDTREETVRPESKVQQPTRGSPYTGLSSSTFIGSPKVNADSHRGRKLNIPENDRSVHVSRTLSVRSWKRRPSGPTLNPAKYQPSPTPSPKPPTREKTGKRSRPHYVRSPLTDPDEKIRFGSPREVHITTPKSVTRKGSTIDDLRPEMPKQNLEPHYQREVNVDPRFSGPESAMPSPLQVEGKDLHGSPVSRDSEQRQSPKGGFAGGGGVSQEDVLPRSEMAEFPQPSVVKTQRERWYVEPTATAFSWKEPDYRPEGKRKEKPLPPLPPPKR